MIMPIDRHYKMVNRMFSFRFLTTLLCLLLMMVVNGSYAKDAEPTLSTQQKKAVEIENNSNKSSSSESGLTASGNELKNNQTSITYGGSMSSFIPNKAALIRSTYVFGGLCFLAIIYFAFRTCRLRRRRGSASRRTGTRKYRPLNTGAGSQEMEPLGDGGDNEDEDEDTLFDTAQPSNVTRPTLGV